MLHNLLLVSNVCEAALNSLFWSPMDATNSTVIEAGVDRATHNFSFLEV